MLVDFFRNLRRTILASPNRPLPNSIREDGSGTGDSVNVLATIVALLSAPNVKWSLTIRSVTCCVLVKVEEKVPLRLPPVAVTFIMPVPAGVVVTIKFDVPLV